MRFGGIRSRRLVSVLAAVAAALIIGGPFVGRAAPGNQCLVVDKVYGPGGGSNAQYNQSFVELLNRCDTAQSLEGDMLVAVNGAATQAVGLSLHGTLGAGRFYLVAYGSPGSIGAPLPTPDASASGFPLPVPGKVYLTSSGALLTCPSGSGLIDFLAYGASSVPCTAEGQPAGSPTPGNSIHRLGCTDTDDNAADTGYGAPDQSAVENSTLASAACGLASPCLVVDKAYGPGGGAGATYNRSFVELLNRCATTISLGDLAVYSLAQDGTEVGALLSGGLVSGRYYLIATAAGSGGAPTPNPNAGITGVFLPGSVFISTVPFAGSGCPTRQAEALDVVGFGSGAPCVGLLPAPLPSATSATRKRGCSVSGANNVDFVAATPLAENTAVSSPVCGGSPDPCLVVNEVYGPGGGTGAAYDRSFVELLNRCATSISLDDLGLSQANSDASSGFTLPLAGPLGPGHSYLVAVGVGGTHGTALPTPDVSTALGGFNPGRVFYALDPTCRATDPRCCPSGQGDAADLVGYGAQGCFEGAAAAPGPTGAQSIARVGCRDTNQNASDFSLGAPTPSNSSSPPAAVPCPSPPTAVTSFGATASRGAHGVVLRWRSGVDLRLLGFDVYRRTGGRRLRLNSTLIRAGVGKYAFVDRAAPRGRLTYVIEAVAVDGTRTPVATTSPDPDRRR